MGRYIEQYKDRDGQFRPLGDHGKARTLAENGATIIEQPGSFFSVPQGQALICVADNGTFEAAAWVFDEAEWMRVTRPDWRNKTWLTLDFALACELTGK